MLAGFDPAEFLANAWQREPRLLRAAMPSFESPITADELAGLSLEDEIESRLILQTDQAWRVEHGPFAEDRFETTGEHDWTLLVNGVDLFVPAVRALLANFDFLPRWRVDDVMVSFAAPGGGVGPHFDYYDVFLLQGEGTREWRLGQWCDAETPVVADAGLKQLANFEESARWTLEPGDILYVPPGLAHWGVATTACLTYSIGFRAPSLAEMIGDLGVELMSRGDDRYYRDPPLTPAMATDRIDPAFIAAIQTQIRALADDPELLADWFARYMTAPKYPELNLDEGRIAVTDAGRYIDGDNENEDEDE